MVINLQKLKNRKNQKLPVDYFLVSLPIMEPPINHQLLMAVDSFQAHHKVYLRIHQEAYLLILVAQDCLLINQQLDCLEIMHQQLQINQKLVDYSVAHHHQQVEVSSISNLVVYHPLKTQDHHFLPQINKMTMMNLVTVLNLKLHKTLKLIQVKAPIITNMNKLVDWLWNKKLSNSKKLVVIWLRMLTLL